MIELNTITVFPISITGLSSHALSSTQVTRFHWQWHGSWSHPFPGESIQCLPPVELKNASSATRSFAESNGLAVQRQIRATKHERKGGLR